MLLQATYHGKVMANLTMVHGVLILYVKILILMMVTVMMIVVFFSETTHQVQMSVVYRMVTTPHVQIVMAYQTVVEHLTTVAYVMVVT